MYHVYVDARALVQGGLVGLHDVGLVPGLVLGAPGVQPAGVELRVYQGPIRLELGKTIYDFCHFLGGEMCLYFLAKQGSVPAIYEDINEYVKLV